MRNQQVSRATSQRIDGRRARPALEKHPRCALDRARALRRHAPENLPREPPPGRLGWPEPYALVPVAFRAVLSVATSQMKPAANPRYETFLVELRKLRHPFVRWKGLLFRASPLEYAQAAKLLDGKGSFHHGGR